MELWHNLVRLHFTTWRGTPGNTNDTSLTTWSPTTAAAASVIFSPSVVKVNCRG